MFTCDADKFKNALLKVIDANTLLRGLSGLISEVSSISFEDGSDNVKDACKILNDLMSSIDILNSDMFNTANLMNIDISGDISRFPSLENLGNLDMEAIFNLIGIDTSEDIIQNLKNSYDFTEEEIAIIEKCINENKVYTILNLFEGIQGYNFYKAFYEETDDKDSQEAAYAKMLDKKNEIDFILNYFGYYEDYAKGNLTNTSASVEDFISYYKKGKYQANASSILLAYGNYLSDNNKELSSLDILDFICRTDGATRNMSKEELDNYILISCDEISNVFLNLNIDMSSKFGKYTDYYAYLTKEDREIYDCLLQTKGVEEANKFLDNLKIFCLNKEIGDTRAKEQLEGLLETDSDVVQFFDQTFDSYKRGGQTVFEKMVNLFKADTNLTATDYETRYIIETISNINNSNIIVTKERLKEFKQTGLISDSKYDEIISGIELGTEYSVLDVLEEIGEVNHEQASLVRKLKENGASEKVLETAEQLGFSLGYMTPSIAATILTSGLTGSVALGRIVGNSIMFVSSAGSKLTEQLRSGATTNQAYGIAFAGASVEVASGYYFGRIPFLSRATSSFQVLENDTIGRAVSKLLLRAITNPALEGLQEVGENKVYDIIADVGRGRISDIDPIDILKWDSNDLNTFCMGALTSTVLNGGAAALTTVTIPFRVRGLTTNLTLAQVLMAYNEGGINRERLEEIALNNQGQTSFYKPTESAANELINNVASDEVVSMDKINPNWRTELSVFYS